MERVTVALLMLYVFAVPWEYSLDLGEPLGNVARILGVLLLVAAVPAVLRRGVSQRPGAVQWLVLALYLFFVCSYFWTVEAESTLEKMRAYFQVMMAVWLVWEIAHTPEQLRGLVRAWVAGCWVLAVLTLASYSSVSAAAEGQIRLVAEGQDPNDVARFLDLGFGMAALEFATERRWWIRLLAIGYVPAGLLAVLLTASRGGFSAALVAMLGSAGLLVMWRPRAASMVFVGLAATVAAIWLYVPAGTLERLATITGELQGGDWNDRLNLWAAGWRAFRHAPWLGYGAGTFPAASGLAAGDTAHNTLVALLVTGGLAGTAIFVAILTMVVLGVMRTEGLMRVALWTTLAVWGVTAMVGSVEENRATWVVFGVMALAGRLAGQYPEEMRAIFSRRASRMLRPRELAASHARI